MNTLQSLTYLEEFKQRLKYLLDTRLELVPFHFMNMELSASQIKQWEILSVFKLLQLKKEDSVLCMEDTLGIMSYLLLPFCNVTYNTASKDRWDFKEQPEKLVQDLSNAPPKHPIFYGDKFTKIVLLSLLDVDPRRRTPTLFAAHKLLAPGGRIVASFTTSETGEKHGGLYPVSPEAWANLLADHSFIEEASEEPSPESTQKTSGSMRIVRLTRS